MRSILLATGLLLVPATAMAGGMEYGGGYVPAPKHVWKDRGELAGGRHGAPGNTFCNSGTATATQTSVSCGTRWIAADGTRFGPVANPANTPKTPYPGANMVWSSSQYGTAGAPAAVWSGQGVGSSYSQNSHYEGRRSSGHYVEDHTRYERVPQARSREVLVTRGASSNTIYTGDWGPAYEAPAPYSGQSAYYSSGNVSSTASYVSEGSYSSSAQGMGSCFSYGANGQPYAVPCQGAMVSQGSSTWTSGGAHQHYRGCGHYVPASLPPAPMPPVNIIQEYPPAPPPPPPVPPVEVNNGFYNSLNGGVGYDGEIYSGGGGGYYAESGGSTSVFSRAPLLRFRNRNTGGGGTSPCNSGGCTGGVGKKGGHSKYGGGHSGCNTGGCSTGNTGHHSNWGHSGRSRGGHNGGSKSGCNSCSTGGSKSGHGGRRH